MKVPNKKLSTAKRASGKLMPLHQQIATGNLVKRKAITNGPKGRK